MAKLFFPQLLTGSLVQYPLRKIKQFRTVTNVYGDGSMTVYPDSGASRIGWEIQYTGISLAELTALQSLYNASCGPLLPFTYIDPVDNMLVSSADLTQRCWNAVSGCSLTAGLSDPTGGSAAFTLTNAGQVAAGLTQSLVVPAGYRYCLSVYVRATTPATLDIQIAGAAASQIQSFSAGSSWTRVCLSGALNDSGSTLAVSLLTPPGESVQIFGPQLEPQVASSVYKATTARGGVYVTCHWTSPALDVSTLAPGIYQAGFGLEAAL